MTTLKQTPIEIAVRNVVREAGCYLDDIRVESKLKKMSPEWLNLAFERAIIDYDYTFTTKEAEKMFLMSCVKLFRKEFNKLFKMCYTNANARISVTYNL